MDASFQAITDLWQDQGIALGKIQLPESLVNEVSNYKLHPVLLDASLQVLGAGFLETRSTGCLPTSRLREISSLWFCNPSSVE
ncbi:MAG UNVERIFIED_CONTAM: polyketide synthase dehydratase domain-containing protein [Microcystis novacekii LVE1205-3]|jgi:hypothetical protein